MQTTPPVTSVGAVGISVEVEVGTVITAQGPFIAIITEFHISIVPKLVLRHAGGPQAGANRG